MGRKILRYLGRRWDYLTLRDQLLFSCSILKRHADILGGTGSGKTTLIKNLLYMTIKARQVIFRRFRNGFWRVASTLISLREKRVNKKLAWRSKKRWRYAQIIFDYHWDIGKDVIDRTVVEKERIMYLDFTVAWFRVGINPFDIVSKSDEEVERYVRFLIEVFETMMEGKDQYSGNMETILRPLLFTLLKKKGSSMQDLMNLLILEADKIEANATTEEEKRAIENIKRSKGTIHEQFFENLFFERRAEITKFALIVRASRILNSTVLNKAFNGKSTIDIEDAINRWMIIIIDMSESKLHNRSSGIIARFLLAKINEIAFRRISLPKRQRKDCFIYMDEFKNYIYPSVFKGLATWRKFNFHLVLAYQTYKQGMNDDQNKELLWNTRLKFVGMNNEHSLKAMTGSIGMKLEKLEELRELEFAFRIDKNRPTIIKARKFVRKNWNKSHYRLIEESANLRHRILHKSGHYEPYQYGQTDLKNQPENLPEKSNLAIQKRSSKKQSDNWKHGETKYSAIASSRVQKKEFFRESKPKFDL